MYKPNFQSTLVEAINQAISERLKVYDEELDGKVKRILEGLTHPDPLMSRKEVAEYLNCSLVTVHEMMKDGRLKFTKIGASTKFNRAEVERLAKTSRRAGL